MDAPDLDNDGIKLSVLLARLRWPDPMVRVLALEKAATLLRDNPSEEMIGQFKAWLSGRGLETEVLAGLIILLKAKMEDVIEWSELYPLISRPSILSDVLLRKLYPDVEIAHDWVDGHSGYALEDFSGDHRFENLKPASYWEHVFQEESEKIGFPYRRQLAYEWRKLLDAGYPAGFSEHYFRPTSTLKFKAHLTPIASDVRFSSFLRTIALAAASAGMLYAYARMFAESAMPIHLDYSSGELSAKPMNWGVGEFSEEALSKAVEENEEVVVYSSGLWATDEDGDHTDVTVKAVLSKPDHKLSAEDLWAKSDIRLSQARPDSDYCFYGVVTLQQNAEMTELLGKDDKEFLPLVVQYWPSYQPAWCWATMLRGYQIIPPLISEGEEFNLEPSEDGIAIVWAGKQIGRLWFWLENWSPTFIIDYAPRVGVSVSLTPQFIQSLEEKFGLKTQYLYRVKTAKRERGYGDYEMGEFIRFL